MKKLLAILLAVAVFAPVAQAQDSQNYKYTIGGQLGYDYNDYDNNDDGKGGTFDAKTQSLVVAPEFGVKLCEDATVGVGLKYGYDRVNFKGAKGEDTHSFGGYVFGEKAIVTVGQLKLFLRADVGMDTAKTKDADYDRTNVYYAQISPNIQYPLTERLTLTVASDVLSLGVAHARGAYDSEATEVGFNVGNNEDFGAMSNSEIKVGLKYAF